MRPWLAVIGILFLTLGLGTAATLYFAGEVNPATSTAVTSPPMFSIGPGGTDVVTLYGSNGTAEQFHFSWHSSGPLNVQLLEPQPCSGPCGNRVSLQNWPANVSGTWSGTGPFDYPLFCVLTNSQSTALNVTLMSRAQATNPTHLSLLFEIALGGGAAALFVVGGLAVFLGIFLRVDPYGPDPPYVSRSADDVEELTREDPPGH